MKLQKKIKLSKYTTFKIGGLAKYFVEVATKEELKEIYFFAKENSLPIFVIGEGSDVLVSDNNFDSIVVRLVNNDIRFDRDLLISGAGVKWDDLVKFAVSKNLQGIECLSGIPGTVGASPVQNIGAYGQELKDTLVKVEVFDTEKGEFLFLENKDCNFGYRESFFKKKKGKYVIFEVVLSLKKNGLPNVNYESLKKYLDENKIHVITLRNIRNAVLHIRRTKLDDPKRIPNAGSFFKNPIIGIGEFERIKSKFPDIPNFVNNGKVKLFAGWLIEKSGWKGQRLGNVGVSTQNALVLVSFGGTADEMKDLSQKIIEDVNAKFDIKLEPEVQFVNF